MNSATPTAPDSPALPQPHPHSRLEDAQGIAFGAVMAAFGALLLGSAGLITGQLAGLALLISQATGWGFGPVYLVLSLPFYGFGYRRMGLGFLRRTIAAVLLMVVASMLLPKLISFDSLHPGAAALLAGFVSGSGLLALFRHRTSLGGIGAVALDLQDRLGVKAGWVQMGFDAVLFAVALMLLPLDRVLWSALGAAVLNLVIAINHRRDRYIV
ncbi:YitT family protein [Paracoccus sp. (in: a-proteobacteria)]|uniref:YitT family protein n=1 Tax=Paracoccus sp. TaxID=267 RepID=UPI0026DEA5D3|nr:YitT family protein [Paracoccus sp. (in: a-proteobacteria)]MDO5369958.1 YitT family protein [Paracoccus sp. (in: a-proteobacteria)]